MKYVLTKSQDNHVVIMQMPKSTKIDTKTDREISKNCLDINIASGLFTDISHMVESDYAVWMLTEDMS